MGTAADKAIVVPKREDYVLGVTEAGLVKRYALPKVRGGQDFIDIGSLEGFDPTGQTDNWQIIQDAIDTYHWGPHIRKIQFPEGNIKISKPLFFDMPENFRGLTTEAYQAGQTYNQYYPIMYSGVRYISRVDNNLNHQPDISPTQWHVYQWDVAHAYVVGDIIYHEGLPYKCGVTNTGEEPILPPKIDGSVNYATGDMVEYRGKYWRVIGSGGAWYNLLYGVYDDAVWEEVPLYWEPTLLVHPHIFYDSIEVCGAGLASAQTAWGTIFRPTFNNTFCLVLSSGQGVVMEDLQIVGPSVGDAFSSYAGQPRNGIGFALCGGPGGSSRSEVLRCEVSSFYTGVKTGASRDALCDSNTFYKLNMYNCYLGIWVAQTQNFINSAYECNVGAQLSLFAAVGTGCNVFGGNFSANGLEKDHYDIDSITVSYVDVGDAHLIVAEVVISNPNAKLAAQLFNWLTLVTENFGVIPFDYVSFDEDTSTVTMRTPKAHIKQNFHELTQNFDANCRIKADIEACDTLYAAAAQIAFIGGGLAVHGVHIESATSPGTMIQAGEGFGSNRPNVFSQIFYNYDTSFNYYSPKSTSDKNSNAVFYAQATFPFINIQANATRISDSQLGISGSPVQIWLGGNQGACRLRIENLSSTQLVCNFGGPWYFNWNEGTQNNYLGVGEWDEPALTRGQLSNTNSVDAYHRGTDGSHYYGFKPRRSELPTISSALLAKYDSLPTLPASNSGNFPNYVLLWGGQTYRIYNEDFDASLNFLASTFMFAISKHLGYTYGQDLAIDWQYKGGSTVLYVSDTIPFIPGLVIILNNGIQDRWYMVVGVYPELDYVIVVGVGDRSQNRTFALDGDIDTIYTGSTIKQQPFAIDRTNDTTLDPYIPPLLDIVPNGISAYSVRKLREAYAGSAMRVRRSSDDAELDIGFTQGDFDIVAFTTFVGSDTAYLVIWYDQSVEGNDLVQATEADQPTVILNGAGGQPTVSFDGTQEMGSTFGSTYNDKVSAAHVINCRNNGVNQEYFFWKLGGAGDSMTFQGSNFATTLQVYIGSQGAINLAGVSGFNQHTMTNTPAFYSGRKAGFHYSLSPHASVTRTDIGNLQTLELGGPGGGGYLPMIGEISELVFWHDDFVSSDKLIKNSQKAYFKV